MVSGPKTDPLGYVMPGFNAFKETSFRRCDEAPHQGNCFGPSNSCVSHSCFLAIFHFLFMIPTSCSASFLALETVATETHILQGYE